MPKINQTLHLKSYWRGLEIEIIIMKIHFGEGVGPHLHLG